MPLPPSWNQLSWNHPDWCLNRASVCRVINTTGHQWVQGQVPHQQSVPLGSGEVWGWHPGTFPLPCGMMAQSREALGHCSSKHFSQGSSSKAVHSSLWFSSFSALLPAITDAGPVPQSLHNLIFLNFFKVWMKFITSELCRMTQWGKHGLSHTELLW